MATKFEKLSFEQTYNAFLPVCARILRKEPGEQDYYEVYVIGLTHAEAVELYKWLDEYLGGSI